MPTQSRFPVWPSRRLCSGLGSGNSRPESVSKEAAIVPSGTAEHSLGIHSEEVAQAETLVEAFGLTQRDNVNPWAAERPVGFNGRLGRRPRPLAAPPVARPPSTMCHGYYLEPVPRPPIHDRERKPTEQEATRVVDVSRPLVWDLGNTFNRTIEFGEECRRRRLASFSIPLSCRGCFGNSFRVEVDR